MYDDGTILAVEVAANWDASIDASRANLGDDAIVTVDGLGGDGQAVGGDIGQLLVLEDAYFVGVMLSTGATPRTTPNGHPRIVLGSQLEPHRATATRSPRAGR